ncbi:acylphosphatase [Salipaludibacillus keqinensis]|uniref:Acylphosphatase n=1 Tax=Salipaludibacillus keqinensis TaxID=2045207 RepID=A0A323TLI2_9BACI|nr:acylphosphatase [Salipaludibacillus keqinensis]PYZ94946.1 acylphosphatase [Salipaludibacillus keqinensis]
MVRYFIKVKGKVQGVGFRKYTKKVARKYSIVGWVRNVNDGTVEAEIQGENEDVDHVIKALHRGSSSSKVHSVEVKKKKGLKNYNSFKILYNSKV